MVGISVTRKKKPTGEFDFTFVRKYLFFSLDAKYNMIITDK